MAGICVRLKKVSFHAALGGFGAIFTIYSLKIKLFSKDILFLLSLVVDNAKNWDKRKQQNNKWISKLCSIVQFALFVLVFSMSTSLPIFSLRKTLVFVVT